MEAKIAGTIEDNQRIEGLPERRVMLTYAARNAIPADPTSKKCPECLSEIPIAARRCAFCTSVVATPTAPGNA